MKPIRPGTVVTFEYPIRDLYRTIRGVVLEPSEYTLPNEVRVEWYDGYGTTNIARERIIAEEPPDA